jgi:hypothetical protein
LQGNATREISAQFETVQSDMQAVTGVSKRYHTSSAPSTPRVRRTELDCLSSSRASGSLHPHDCSAWGSCSWRMLPSNSLHPHPVLQSRGLSDNSTRGWCSGPRRRSSILVLQEAFHQRANQQLTLKYDRDLLTVIC